MTITTGDVRSFILNYFSDQEIDALCFVYFQEAEHAFSEGMSKDTKTRKLIDHCQNRGKIPDLFAALQAERPVVFAQCFTGPLPNLLDDAFPESEPAVVSVNALQVSEVLADRIIAEKSASIRVFMLYLAGLLVLGIAVIAGAWVFLVDASRQIASVGGVFICSLGALQVRGIIDRNSQKSRCQTIKDILLMIRQGQGSVDADTWKQIQDFLWGEMKVPVSGQKVLI